MQEKFVKKLRVFFIISSKLAFCSYFLWMLYFLVSCVFLTEANSTNISSYFVSFLCFDMFSYYKYFLIFRV